MPRRSLSLRRRAARRQRGAVFVESIIVAAMLMIFLAGGMFFHHLYSAKIRSMGEARAAGWLQALHGCDRSVDVNGVWSEVGQDPEADVDTSSAPGFSGTLGRITGSASRSVGSDSHVGGNSYTLSTSNIIACNEVAQDERGDIGDLIGYASANLIPSFF